MRMHVTVTQRYEVNAQNTNVHIETQEMNGENDLCNTFDDYVDVFTAQPTASTNAYQVTKSTKSWGSL